MSPLFSPDALQKIVTDMLPPPEQAQLAIVGTVDKTGAQIVAGFTSKGGAWALTGAYRHEWATGDDQVTAKLMFKF